MQRTEEFICKSLGVTALSVMVLACLNYKIRTQLKLCAIDSVLCVQIGDFNHIFNRVKSFILLIKCGGAVTTSCFSVLLHNKGI